MSAGARGKAIDGGRRTFIVIVYGGRREHWATGASLPRNIVHDVDVLLYFMMYFLIENALFAFPLDAYVRKRQYIKFI